MAYQPNDFVNPNQRGVELPPGCKDIHDMLHKLATQKPAERPIFPVVPGTLKDVPRYVQSLYMEQYGLCLVVGIRAAKAMIWVRTDSRDPSIRFLIGKENTTMCSVVKELFREGEFQERAGEKVILITTPLPTLWLEAAQIIERVIRACDDDAENSNLLFHFVWAPKRDRAVSSSASGS